MTRRVSVVGLGKLGVSIAAAIASRGFEVIGVDVRRDVVECLNAGRSLVQEPNLAETIRENRARIRATTSYREAILDSDLTFVVVPTPSDSAGAFSLEYVETAFRACGQAIREKQTYHTVVLMSTVLPGATRVFLLPIVEQSSGKKAGRDFCVLYGPQFVALGSVIHDFLNPSFVLIGECERGEGEILEALYKKLLENGASCIKMSVENAELTKIAVNTFVTTKISFANTLADLCERIPGGDVDVVSDALGLDPRIGKSCLRGSLGYGGPCFPRDNLAFSYLAAKLGTRAPLAEATDFINRSRPREIIKQLSGILCAGQRAAVLGLAYKPATPVIDESQAIYLVTQLTEIGLHVTAYDPLANEVARLALGNQVTIANSLASCITDAEVVFVATPDPAFNCLSSNDLAGKTVIDFWRMLDAAALERAKAVYLPLGRELKNF